jgi:hypothetical protein
MVTDGDQGEREIGGSWIPIISDNVCAARGMDNARTSRVSCDPRDTLRWCSAVQDAAMYCAAVLTR